MPKVSVIMAVLNSCDTIDLAIESIINQSFDDWELVICDDGSTDGTYKKICDYVNRDKRIRAIRNKENLGLAYSLNRCIEVSSGEYIARQDGDDYSGIERLKKQVEFLDCNFDFDIVGTSVKLFDENKVWGKRIIKEFPHKRDFLWGTQFIHPSVMIRKTSLIRVGCYRVAKETRRVEDYDLFMRMYELEMKGCNLLEALFYYREDNNSYKKRKFRYRIDEMFVRYKRFKALGLFPLGIVFVIKPLVLVSIPNFLLKSYRRHLN